MLQLYYSKASPSCRAVLCVAKEIGVELELKYINLYREENLTQDFLKINPSGTIPALVDREVKVWDSHAIGIYLVQKFAKDDKLYPKDFLKRTTVNERLFFEASFLFARLFEICDPICDGRETSISDDKISRVIRGYENVERFFIDDHAYVAGDTMTLADFSIWSTLLVLNLLIPIDSQKFPKLTKYLKMLEGHESYEFNFDGALKQTDFIEKCMEKAKNYKINTFELVYPKPDL